jgi:hypothetical protein
MVDELTDKNRLREKNVQVQLLLQQPVDEIPISVL